jgi:hypothetical protein
MPGQENTVSVMMPPPIDEGQGEHEGVTTGGGRCGRHGDAITFFGQPLARAVRMKSSRGSPASTPG